MALPRAMAPNSSFPAKWPIKAVSAMLSRGTEKLLRILGTAKRRISRFTCAKEGKITNSNYSKAILRINPIKHTQSFIQALPTGYMKIA
jgi:hypothetical protein